MSRCKVCLYWHLMLSCRFRWVLWLAAMGSPSQLSIWMPLIACWSPSFTAGDGSEGTNPLWWSSSFTSWRTSLKTLHNICCYLIPLTLTTVLYVQYSCAASGLRAIQSSSFKKQNFRAYPKKVSIYLIHSQVERSPTSDIIAPCKQIWVRMKPRMDHHDQGAVLHCSSKLIACFHSYHHVQQRFSRGEYPLKLWSWIRPCKTLKAKRKREWLEVLYVVDL